MSLNLVDSKGIMATYEAVLNDELNWLLLYYSGNTADELALYAYGADGLEELKTKIDPSNTEQVLIGFLRADDMSIPESEFYGGQGFDYHHHHHYQQQLRARRREASVRDEVKYVLISYVPKDVFGVRRGNFVGALWSEARAQVHARRLGMIFKKHDAMLTVEDYWQLTNSAIARSLAGPDSYSSPSSPTVGVQASMAGSGPGSLSSHIPLPPTAGTVIYTTDSNANSNTVSPSSDLPSHHPLPSLPATRMGRSLSQPVPYNKMPTGSTSTQTTDAMDLKPLRTSDPHYTQDELQRHTTTANFGGQQRYQQQQNIRQGGHVFGQFLRRKKHGRTNRGGDMEESQESEDSMPPPTPPKDKGIYATVVGFIDKRRVEDNERDPYAPHQQRRAYTDDDLELHRRKLENEELGLLPGISEASFQHSRDASEYAIVSHEDSRREGEVVVIHPNDYESTRGVPTPVQALRMESLKKGKWAEPQGLSAIRDPVERARLRIEMQRQREEEEREILRAEEERQERIKREKQELLRREEEEAERRKAVIQAEALRVAAERRRREEEERIEEERKAREREEKKRVEKQKRIEEHLRLEEWRKTQQRLKEESTKAEEEAKRREEEERKQKILQAKQEVKTKARDGAMAGWVTIQTDESVVWRRRYFKFAPNSLYFYRSPEDMTQAVERLDIRGAVAALKEPAEGYEDLAAIPHSFAIEFNGRPPWSMFADSEDDKASFRLLGLLQYGAGW